MLIVKRFAAHIEDEGADAFGAAMSDFIFDKAFTIIGLQPFVHIKLTAEIECTFVEGFERDGVIAEIIV